MAEIVATAAAVVQFVDVTVRLSSGLGRLCSDVRNVPHRFYRLQRDVRQQVEVAQHIQAHYLPAFATTALSSTFDAPLIEYIALADELCETLDKLLVNRTDGLLKRGWSTLCSIRKKEDVFQMCDRLEQRKSTLSMWMCAANLYLSSNVTATTDLIKLNAEETLGLTKTVKDSSSKAVASTERLLPQLEEINRIITSSSQTTEQMMKDIQYLKNQSAIDVRQPRFVSTDTIRSLTTGSLKPIAGNDSLADRWSNFVLQRIARTTASELEHLEQSHVGFTREDSRAVEADARSGNCARCTCRTVNHARQWQPLSILRLRQTFRTHHFSFCPEYRSSEQSLEFTMQLVPPSWLLWHTVDLGFQVKNLWTTKAFSICPIIIGTSKLVDSRASPAFRAIMDTKDALYSTGLHHIYIPRLQDTLEDLFNQRKASALDTDCNGRTLLNEVLWIYKTYIHRRSKPGDEYVSLIQFLLDKGADPNTMSSSAATETFERFDDVGGTTFDQFARTLLIEVPVSSSVVSISTQLRNLTIFKRLAAVGSEFSKPFNSMSRTHPRFRCVSFTDEIEEFTCFEDQIDLCELGGWIPIVLQQHGKQFQRSVNRAKLSDLNRSSPTNGLALAHFAVLWPSGLKILIDKGANINVEDCYGRRPIHLAVALGVTDAVGYLIKADCALFSPSDGGTLLQHALLLKGPQRHQILDMLVAGLIDRHTRLLDMARELLPSSSFSKLNMVEGQKKERYAPWICEILVSHGVHVPEALELDGESFYNFGHMHGNIKMTPDVANAFWNSGFDDINEPDRNGLTPLLQSWFCADFEMVAWFAEKGIPLSSTHRDAPLTALHFYAQRIWYPGLTILNILGAVPTDKHYMARIQEEIGIPYDECYCPCSPSGCTPVKFLSRDPKFQHRSQKGKFQKFLENVEPKKSVLKQYIREFTRCLLFNFLGGKHTCCSLGQECYIEINDWNDAVPQTAITKEDKLGREIDEARERNREHILYCLDGIPTPRKRAPFSSEDAEWWEMTLDDLMSHYDEMPRPDTMLPEEQPFHYLNWIIAERYLTVDVDLGYACSDSRTLGHVPPYETFHGSIQDEQEEALSGKSRHAEQALRKTFG